MSDSVTHHRSFEVLTAERVRSRRKLRHWSDEDKARLVAEALAPGSNVSAIARSHGLDPSQVYAWRRKALASGAVSPLTGGRSSRSGSRALKRWAVRWWIVVGDVVVRVGGDVDPDRMVQIVRAVRKA